jgi:hypothetical protein
LVTEAEGSSRDEVIAAAPDQLRPAGLDQGFPHGEIVFGLEELHQRALHLPIPKPFRYIDFLLGERAHPVWHMQAATSGVKRIYSGLYARLNVYELRP